MPNSFEWLSKSVNGENGGPVLFPHGIQKTQATDYFHVCYGENKLYSYNVAFALEKVMAAADIRKRYGTGNMNTRPNTGYGVLLTPAELNATSQPFVPDPALIGHRHRAEEEVKRILRAGGWTVIDATVEQNISGFDFTVEETNRRYDVKSRVKTFKSKKTGLDHLFVQTHECNEKKNTDEKHHAKSPAPAPAPAPAPRGQFWTDAIDRIAKKRMTVKNIESEQDWQELTKLNWLEDFAKACQRLS